MSQQEITFHFEEKMSFKEKNITVSLISSFLILSFYVRKMSTFIQEDGFSNEHVFRLWGSVIVLTIILTIVLTILTHIASAIVQTIKTGNEDPEIDELEDERDKLIDLKGTKVMYFVSSIGGFFAMLTFVLGQSPLVMFSLLILFGILAQIVGDISRLAMYRRGF